MTPQPWFRCYSETLRDRKIERICRETQMPKVLVVGTWNVLLMLANDSPVRGALLLTEDIPLTFDDLMLETGLDNDSLTSLLHQFERMLMLSNDDGIYYVTNWCKRQFASDSSTERVRRWREQQRKASENGRCNGDDETDGSVTETLQKHSGNGPETETETETDIGAANAPEHPPPIRGGYSKGQKAFLHLFGAKRFKLVIQAQTVRDLEQKYGTDKLIELATWAAKQGMSVGKAVVSVESALKKQAGDAGPKTVKVGI